MAYLTVSELTTAFYKPAAAMNPDTVTTKLAQANSFCKGIIGGDLPAANIDDDLKAAVALAFEVFTKDDTAQVDDDSGAVTEAAPGGAFVRNKARDPLTTVENMLGYYKRLYEQIAAPYTNKGVRFF